MRKRILFSIVMIVLFVTSIVLTGCNLSKAVNNNGEEETTVIETVNESEIEYVYSNPEKYEGKKVTLKGQVSDSVEKTKEGTSFMMYADPNSIKNSADIYCDGIKVNVKDDDYVIVEGIIVNSSYGDKLNMGEVVLKATKITKSNYIDVVEPTQKKYKINKTINQKGYKVTFKKLELAKDETRVYLKVKNNGGSQFSLDTYSAKIIQGSKQYNEEKSFNADYEEIPDNLEKGVKAKGIVTFPRIKEDKNFVLKMEAHSDNWDENLNDYIYKVRIK